MRKILDRCRREDALALFLWAPRHGKKAQTDELPKSEIGLMFQPPCPHLAAQYTAESQACQATSCSLSREDVPVQSKTRHISPAELQELTNSSTRC